MPAFRGTKQVLKDFITDLETGHPPLKQDEIDVHDGFAKALGSVWNEISSSLNQFDCPVFYAGHSLGAALATLAAAKRAPKAVYAYGSPRVGNHAFGASLAGIPVYRVVDDKDAVAAIPPEALGFRHAGSEYRLTAPKGRSLFQYFFGPPKPLADHAPINYVDRIAMLT